MADPITIELDPRTTLTVDPDDVLDRILGIGQLYADVDPDDDGPAYRVDSVQQQLIKHAAARLVHRIGDSINVAVNEQVQQTVGAAIQKLLDEGVQATDRFGRPQGERQSLVALIATSAEEWLTKKTGSYGDGKTNLQKAIDEAVNTAWARELGTAITAAKQRVTAAVTTKAAELLGTTIVQMGSEAAGPVTPAGKL